MFYVVPSLNEPDVYYIFREDGQEVKVRIVKRVYENTNVYRKISPSVNLTSREVKHFRNLIMNIKKHYVRV